MKPFYIFNTLGRRVEEFQPLNPPVVTYYSCGPTVYLPQHLGNMRAYVFVDTLRRALELNGYDVRHVMNITDVGHMTSDADTGEDKTKRPRAPRARRRARSRTFILRSSVATATSSISGCPRRRCSAARPTTSPI